MDAIDLCPVTLVVKAPNQKIEDQVIECGLEWTIRKLKEHLSMVYPNKPQKHHQKLIYSGKLLTDHLVLKDVLRQYEEDQTTHTVHLVCAQEAMSNHSPSPAATERTASTAAPLPASTDGLRHRATTIPVPTIAPPTQAMPVPQQAGFAQMYPGLDPMMYAGFYPGQMAMSAEQMMWMQQMYTQQMAQFMQYYQTGGMATPPLTPTVPHTSAAVAVPPAQPAAPAVVQPAPANNQPAPVRMNAQGGQMVDDDDNGGQRDWLDWIYMLTRFIVIISIVYFNSSLSRFLVVIGISLLFYLYQMVWSNMRRARQLARQVEAQAAAAAAAPPPPPPAVADQPPAQEAHTEAQEGQQGESEVSTTPEETPAEPPPPPPPSTFQVTCSFISTFFSSLIPAQPPAVNAN